MKRKKVVCLTGPSGIGKTSYAKRFQTELNFAFPEIVTTRTKRQDDGAQYRYVREEIFNLMVGENLFLEHDKYLSYRYGTLHESVKSILQKDDLSGAVLDLTPSGCGQVQALISDAIVIAIVPNEVTWLKKRLMERNTQGLLEINSRSMIIESYLSEIDKLGCEKVISYYSPVSWDATFKEITRIVASFG